MSSTAQFLLSLDFWTFLYTPAFSSTPAFSITLAYSSAPAFSSLLGNIHSFKCARDFETLCYIKRAVRFQACPRFWAHLRFQMLLRLWILSEPAIFERTRIFERARVLWARSHFWIRPHFWAVFLSVSAFTSAHAFLSSHTFWSRCVDLRPDYELNAFVGLFFGWGLSPMECMGKFRLQLWQWIQTSIQKGDSNLSSWMEYIFAGEVWRSGGTIHWMWNDMSKRYVSLS